MNSSNLVRKFPRQA